MIGYLGPICVEHDMPIHTVPRTHRRPIPTARFGWLPVRMNRVTSVFLSFNSCELNCMDMTDHCPVQMSCPMRTARERSSPNSVIFTIRLAYGLGLHFAVS